MYNKPSKFMKSHDIGEDSDPVSFRRNCSGSGDKKWAFSNSTLFPCKFGRKISFFFFFDFFLVSCFFTAMVLIQN